mgnify:CR=1 FL=1
MSTSDVELTYFYCDALTCPLLFFSSSTANAVLEAARKAKSPVIIQVSNGGGSFVAGKGLKFADSSAVGSVALAMHVRSVAKYYGIPVILHSDHCAKNLLPWFDGMIKADEEFFAKYGEPLFGCTYRVILDKRERE